MEEHRHLLRSAPALLLLLLLHRVAVGKEALCGAPRRQGPDGGTESMERTDSPHTGSRLLVNPQQQRRGG